jgi:mono/diheme cytochrome c family protein
MSRISAAAIIALAAASFLCAASVAPGDARRGEQLFHSEQCTSCHSLKGAGGTSAPDLGKRLSRDFTPAALASLMWNHAPEMWAGMKKQGIVKAQLSSESAADLFAYFVSVRYFERPGDAGRGKQAFAARHCAECHGITTSIAAGAPPVNKWESLADPVVLAQQMWNHGGKMREAFAARKISWPQLTAQELTDIVVYLQNVPETRSLAANFQFPPSDSGGALFESKGCAGCHTGKMALETRLREQTLTQIAASMWNHQPAMKQPAPQLSQEEMRQLIGHIWARQYFRGDGNAARGKQVFTAKNCAGCHTDPAGGTPKLARGKDGHSEITMLSSLWEHGPRMLDSMTEKKIAWPRFTAAEMADLVAYLNSL